MQTISKILQQLLGKTLSSCKERIKFEKDTLIAIAPNASLSHFSINNLDQLPTIKDFQKEENSIGNEEEV